jgi:hypothetical protein
MFVAEGINPNRMSGREERISSVETWAGGTFSGAGIASIEGERYLYSG